MFNANIRFLCCDEEGNSHRALGILESEDDVIYGQPRHLQCQNDNSVSSMGDFIGWKSYLFCIVTFSQLYKVAGWPPDYQNKIPWLFHDFSRISSKFPDFFPNFQTFFRRFSPNIAVQNIWLHLSKKILHFALHNSNKLFQLINMLNKCSLIYIFQNCKVCQDRIVTFRFIQL